jgi:hypothetical protein
VGSLKLGVLIEDGKGTSNSEGHISAFKVPFFFLPQKVISFLDRDNSVRHINTPDLMFRSIPASFAA